MRPAVLAVLLLGGSACGESRAERMRADSVEAAARAARVAQQLADSGGRTDTPLAKWLMPDDMQEISGIALTPEGDRVLAHADEQAHIVTIDWRTGMVHSRFDLGDHPVVGDFEGITRVGTTYYLMTSKAQIYSFSEGAHGSRVPYTVVDTKLGSECEFEGIGHDPRINALLLPCKITKKSMRDSLVIYRWPLGENPEPVSRLTIPVDAVIGTNDWEEVSPADITVDPYTGHYVLVTARERALIVLTPDGRVVSAGPVPTGIPHTEGVAITRDGVLIITGEAGDAPASMTLFRWTP